MLESVAKLNSGSLLGAVNVPSSVGGGPHRDRLRRRLRRSSVQAFTLVELLIMVTILVILVAVAIPRYQQARSFALISAQVGDMMGLARACATINASGVGLTPTPAPLQPDRGGVQITQGCTAENQGATLQASWGSARASGIACLNSKSSLTSSKATLTVSVGSALSCAFED